MPRKSKAHRSRAQNISQSSKQPFKATVDAVQDPELTEIIGRFACMEEDGFDTESEGVDSEDEEGDGELAAGTEIREDSNLQLFASTLQRAHDAATAAERERQRGNKRPRTYSGHSKRTLRRHELNQKELEKKGYTSVKSWFAKMDSEKGRGDLGEVSAECVSSDDKIDGGQGLVSSQCQQGDAKLNQSPVSGNRNSCARWGTRRHTLRHHRADRRCKPESLARVPGWKQHMSH